MGPSYSDFFVITYKLNNTLNLLYKYCVDRTTDSVFTGSSLDDITVY